MLTALGLSEREESLYRALISCGEPVPAGVLALRVDLGAGEIRTSLAGLAARGLITQQDGCFAVAPPAIALGALLRRQHDDLRGVELELVSLVEAHRRATLGRSESDILEVIAGADAVRHRFAQVQYAARADIRCMVIADAQVVPPGANDAEPVTMARGVRYRVIVDRPWLERAAAKEIIVAALDEGEEIRVVNHVPMKMIIADRELGMLPLSSEEQTAAASILVHRSGVLDTMIALFDELWSRARPLSSASETAMPVDSRSRLDDLDRQIIGLMLAGLTDHAIGSHLELSARTVQRRIRQLMDLAGVSTRVQLGWAMARQDWL